MTEGRLRLGLQRAGGPQHQLHMVVGYLKDFGLSMYNSFRRRARNQQKRFTGDSTRLSLQALSPPIDSGDVRGLLVALAWFQCRDEPVLRCVATKVPGHAIRIAPVDHGMLCGYGYD
jgi:hypothetical protein